MTSALVLSVLSLYNDDTVFIKKLVCVHDRMSYNDAASLSLSSVKVISAISRS